jgi:hypothetical protein
MVASGPIYGCDLKINKSSNKSFIIFYGSRYYIYLIVYMTHAISLTPASSQVLRILQS